MLLRRSPSGSIGITQPAHAWLSGELARAWGNNGGFDVPAPRERLTQAAALHDIGWLDWECSPERDATTGLPLQFLDVPAEIHTDLWRRGVAHARTYGDLLALIVSRHGDAIYERTFDEATARPEAAHAVRVFRQEQAQLQEGLIARLSGTVDAEHLAPAHLDRVKRFVVAVDTMSLNLCWGLTDRVTIADVPHAAGGATLVLDLARDGGITVDPWPFALRALTFDIPAIRLTPEGGGTPMTIQTVLRPAR